MKSIFRDFIYMDTERLKSIIAQLNQGLIESTSKTVTNGDQDKLNSAIDIIKIFKFGAESSFLWQNQETESHTLHDYIYNLAESSLIDKELLINIPNDITYNDLINPSLEQSQLTSTSFIFLELR